jgi:hypothetical protein
VLHSKHHLNAPKVGCTLQVRRIGAPALKMVLFLFRVPTLLKPSQSCFCEIITVTAQVFWKIAASHGLGGFMVTGVRDCHVESPSFLLSIHVKAKPAVTTAVAIKRMLFAMTFRGQTSSLAYAS